MDIFNRTIILKDESGDIKDRIVIYDFPIDLNLFIKDLEKLRKKEGWTYDDLTELLDSYGSYRIYENDDFITLYY